MSFHYPTSGSQTLLYSGPNLRELPLKGSDPGTWVTITLKIFLIQIK